MYVIKADTKHITDRFVCEIQLMFAKYGKI
jgi:hypothetical protein